MCVRVPDRSRPVCLGVRVCVRVSKTSLDRSRPVYLSVFACVRVSQTGQTGVCMRACGCLGFGRKTIN